MDNQQTKQRTKRFTVAEATAMLPLVRSITADICDVFRSVTGRRSDLHRLLRRGNGSAGSQYAAEMAESRADLQAEYDEIWRYREELESLGVFLRQPEDGVIEFPALIDGRPAYLCWQLGDSDIRFWRDASSPNSAQQPLPAFEESN